MVFWFIGALVLSLAISFLMTPKPRNQKPAGIEEFDIPTAKLGRDIPVLFGRKMIKAPNVVWYGDLRTRRIRKSSGFSKVTVGHKYYLGMHMVLCHGATAGETITLHEIWVGDQRKWSGTSTGGAITVSGVGTVDFLNGNPAQGRNAYLQSQLGADIPAFRGVVSVVLRQVYLGESPYMEPWTFVVSRYPDGVQTGLDARPMSMISEVLTNKTWGMGYNSADIHAASFSAAATTLNSEAFGLSMIWDRGTEINDFVPEILRHVDGSIYIDRNTGQFRAKLIRNDYDINTLPLFDESNISKVEKFKSKQQSEVVNTVSIKYHKRSSNDDGSISVQDSALHADMGGTVSSSGHYPGITTEETAAKVAWRDLRALSVPFASCTISTTREGATLNPGDAFLLSWPRYNLQQSVMRCLAMTRDKNNVKIECVQDIFGGADVIYAAPPASEWQPILNNPVAVQHHTFIEAPYYWLVRELGQAAADTVKTNTSGYMTIGAASPLGDAAEAQLWVNDGTGYAQQGEVGFSSRTTLTAAVTLATTVLPIAVVPDDVAVGSWAQIGNEIVSVKSFGVGTVTVGRGCLDTVPVAHSSGAAVMFVSESLETIPPIFPTGKTINARLLTITSTGILAIGDATTVNLTFNGRAVRPYAPARIRVNNQIDPSSLTETLTVTWYHRNRLTQIDSAVLDTESASVTVEPGTTYTIELRRVDNNALLYTQSGLTGTTHTINYADYGSYDGEMYLLAWSVRDGFAAWQKQQRNFNNLSGYVVFITSDDQNFTDFNDAQIYVVE